MKRIKPMILWSGLFLFAAFLLRFPKAAADGALQGLILSFKTVIPALFPYFVLSNLFIRFGAAKLFAKPLQGILNRIFHLPGSCAPALILGFLGGYPIGAKTAAELYNEGLCSKADAASLLSFCSCAGPGFILGFVGSGIFRSTKAGMLLWAVHILSALLTGLLLRRKNTIPQNAKTAVPASSAPFSESFVSSLSSAVQSSLGICGTVVFFSVLLSLLHAAGLLSPLDDSALLSALLCGALELTGGISRLPNTLSPLSAAAASFLLGWGGLCVHMQTLSVLTGSGIPVNRYFLGKALHGSIGAVLAYLLFSRPGISLPASFPGQTPNPLPNMFFYSVPLLLFLLLCIFRKKAGKTGTQRL